MPTARARFACSLGPADDVRQRPFTIGHTSPDHADQIAISTPTTKNSLATNNAMREHHHDPIDEASGRIEQEPDALARSLECGGSALRPETVVLDQPTPSSDWRGPPGSGSRSGRTGCNSRRSAAADCR